VSCKEQAFIFSGLQVIQSLGFIFATLVLPPVWNITVGTPWINTFLYIEIGVFIATFVCTCFLSAEKIESSSSDSQDVI
jgi:hypothetical protein